MGILDFMLAAAKNPDRKFFFYIKMTTEEILQIGKVERDIENIAIIERFKEQISSWLKSDKFQQIAEGGAAAPMQLCPIRHY